MPHNSFVELDVRPHLADGRSPLPLIVNTADSLEEGQALRLLTSWEPIPLYGLLDRKGFKHESRKVDDSLWIVDFTRAGEREPEGT